MKISKGSSKVIIMGGIILGAILVFVFFIYIPKYKQVKELRSKLNIIQEDINRIQGIAGTGEDLDIIMGKYNERLKSLKQDLPAREEAALRDLATVANEMGIRVLSITPRVAVTSNLPINIEGYMCKELHIYLKLESSYRGLGDYLEILQNRFPALIKVNKVDIRKEGEAMGASILSASVDITLYMVVPAPGD